MRIAITGAGGRFGKGLQLEIAPRHTVSPLLHADVDITNADDVERVLAKIRPDVIVHAAALPDIDYCETHPVETQRVNVDGTRNVVSAARQIGAGVVHISTDAVFDGKKGAPYVETDATNPISVYGRSKLAAEEVVKEYEKHWIFRVSVLFGPGKENFVSKAIQQVREGVVHKVASDQLGSATYTLDAGEKILEVMEAKAYGLFAVMELAALRDRGFEAPRRWQGALRDYVKTYAAGGKQ